MIMLKKFFLKIILFKEINKKKKYFFIELF